MSGADAAGGGAGSSQGTDPLVGTVFHDKYRVLERLGVGGFGTVYRVRNLRLETQEALKVIHRHVVLEEAQLERFRQEAQLLRRLGMRSPHIPLVHDFDRDDEHEVWFFTLEYVPGTSLRDLVAVEGSLPVSRALTLMRQVCSALAVAHGADPPVIHRDLKPDNVMVLREEGGEHLKILDFGIARILGETGFTSTQAGVHGSAGYIAPEQMEGVANPRTDLFAAGVTLHVTLTGRDPWLDKPVTESLGQGEAHRMLRQALFEEPIPLRSVEPGLPRRLEEIVLRLLEKDPEDRFRSAAELDAALARVESGEELPIPAAKTVVVTEETRTEIEKSAGVPPGTLQREGTVREVARTALARIGRIARAVRQGTLRLRRAVRWSVLAAIVVLALAAVAGPRLWPDGSEPSGVDVVSLEEVRQGLEAGRLEQVASRKDGELRVRFDDGLEAAVAWGDGDGSLQQLMTRLRGAGVDLDTRGEGRLRILTRGPGGGPGEVGPPPISVEGEGELCDACPLSEELSASAGWYRVEVAGGGGTLDSVLVRHAAGGRGDPPTRASLPANEVLSVEGGAPELFVPAGLRTELTLVLSNPMPLEPDSLAVLLEAAQAAYRRGAWTSPPGENLVRYLDRILGRDPGNRRALALRDSLARSFERLIERALATGDAGRAREIAERCLEAVPDATECELQESTP